MQYIFFLPSFYFCLQHAFRFTSKQVSARQGKSSSEAEHLQGYRPGR
jgi:hypothetical protein